MLHHNQQVIGGYVRPGDGGAFRRIWLRKQRVEMRRPSTGKQVGMIDVRGAKEARHGRDQNVVLNEMTA